MVDRRRASSRGSRGGRDGGRRAAGKKGNNTAILAGGGVLLVAVIGLVAYLAMSGGDEKKDADQTTVAENGPKPAPAGMGTAIGKPPVDDIFSGSSSAHETESVGGTDTPTPVVGREPKTISERDLQALKDHEGRIYLDEEAAAAIPRLIAEFERYQRERWDATPEMLELAKTLDKQADDRKRDPFFSEADTNLRQLNNRYEKSELHLKRPDGSLVPQPFIGYLQKPYAVFLQATGKEDQLETAKKAVALAVQLKGAFDEYFGEFLDLKALKAKKRASAGKHAIKIVFLQTHDEYRTYNRLNNPEQDIPGALAHYEPDAGRLVVPLTFGESDDPKQAEHEFREVFFHEGTHQLLNYYTGTNHLSAFGAMWSDEGVAEYFAGHHMDDEGVVHFGRLNNRIRALEGGFAKQFRVPLVEMVKFTRYNQRKMREEQKASEANRLTNAVYANGWALVYFMNNFDGQKYRGDFQKIMKLQIEDGDAGLPVIRTVIGDARIDDFEREFDQYQDWLGKVRKSGLVKDGVIPDPSP
ncbi:MAG: DUF1570 domain-containing protein [Planctomycetota bacterium]